ncbi:hypothetical protein UFOVP1437_47 [uncultured Caudovirales phage]|uniref:Uncharacterized protein n=1 Tax=uncultured Caudovirales phage TaxID=2100421 RepID=A0A6J7XE54_9CAUD|nr:hypothetical protein UFOVP1437_47 [uncultured Caudovirales phage]CAB5228124.1 hypothetical protein UFOVP1531_18 [uncultured Caudovirales phage]
MNTYNRLTGFDNHWLLDDPEDDGFVRESDFNDNEEEE